MAYLPDHEPALGQRLDRTSADWISGHSLAKDANLLIHDAQYTDAEYPEHIGWGHSGLTDTITFARRSGVERVGLFHHDPVHDDAALDALGEQARAMAAGGFSDVSLAREQRHRGIADLTSPNASHRTPTRPRPTEKRARSRTPARGRWIVSTARKVTSNASPLASSTA